MVVWRNSIHSLSIWRSDFCVGRPSRPIMVRLIGAELSRLVCASSAVMSSCCSMRLVLGSNTRRTGASLLDSSRTTSSTISMLALSCVCSWRQRLLAGLDLGVGELLDLFQHALRAHAGRQLGHHQLPLAARQVFDLPARAHLEAAAAGAVGVGDVARRADDLAAAGVVGAGHDGEQFVVGELGRLDQRHAGVGDLAQVVAGDLGGQAHGDAAGAVEQDERQARGQLAAALRWSRRSWG